MRNQGQNQSSPRKTACVHFLLLTALLLSLSTVAAAEGEGEANAEKKEVKEVEEVIKTGVIANTGSYPDGAAVDVDTQGASPGDEQSVIRGSVSPSGRGSCAASVSNGSEENTYSVRFKVVGINDRGHKAINKTYSTTLKPQATETKNVACKPEYRMSVVLLSANKR